MKKLSAGIFVSLFALVLMTAPAFAESACKMAAMTGKCPMSVKSCATTAADSAAMKQGNCSGITLAIEGMKDAEAESQISKALAAENGVICVKSISSKDGQAVVCVNPEKTEAVKLVNAVTALGYKTKLVTQTEAKAAMCSGKSAKCEMKCMGGSKTN